MTLNTRIAKAQARKPGIADLLMAEHVEMPGFPQIIVTRHFCYQWLKARGWDVCATGFGSLDYAAFGRSAVPYPLTDETERDYWLNKVADDYAR